jgi:hypothetical protein
MTLFFRTISAFILLLFLNFTCLAQINSRGNIENVSSFIELGAVGTSNDQVPFWMRTNNYGSNPIQGASGFLVGSIKKGYRVDSLNWTHSRWDWATGIEARINGGNIVNVQLIELYVKAKYAMFQIQGGRTKDMMGLVDSSLSSGAFAVSGNAFGIPKIELSIPDYWPLPILRQVVSIKGNFAVGDVGTLKTEQAQQLRTSEVNTFYHQKSLYVRIARPNWRVKLYGGINHQVFWGDERVTFGKDYELNNIQSFWYVVTGRAYGNKSVLRSKVGNHIGSVDQAITYDFNSLQLKGYHQFFYDVGGLYHLNNIRDGLWGFSIERKSLSDSKIFIKKILFEFLDSRSQGGELKSKVTPSGDEDYYNNYVYTKGWTYRDENIGNNFFTNKKYQKKDLPHFDDENFGNNRIMLLHVGAEWSWNKWQITNKVSFSRNYGTYATSPIGNSTGSKRIIQPPPYFYPVNQSSTYIQASRALKKNYSITFVLATDYGDLLYNSLGGMVKLTKSW